MTRDLVDRLCEDMPGAEVGEDRGAGRRDWVLGGTVFASLGADAVALRDADDASRVADAPDAGVPGGGAGWTALPYGGPEADLAAAISASYAHARASLPEDETRRLPVWTLPG